MPDLPQPGPLPESEQRHRLFDAVSAAVLTAGRPVLLIVDDLQHGDRETCQLVHYLQRVQPQARVLVVATARREDIDDDHPIHDLLAGLHTRERLGEIELTRLNRDETAQLAAGLTGAPLTGPDAQQLYGETEGNPLFVVEALRAGWTAGHALSPRVQSVIEVRLAALSEPARELVVVAAAIGREFSTDVLGAAADAGEATLVRSLDELWRRRIVRERATALLAPLVSVQGYASPAISASQQRAGELARALGVDPAPPLLRSLAVSALTRDDFQEAARAGHLLRAAGEHDSDDALLVEAAYVLGIASFWQADFEQARRHFDVAIERYRPQDRRTHLIRYGQDPKVICQSRLGNTLWFLGRAEDACAARSAALAWAEEIEHPYSRAGALVFGALLALDMADEPGVRRYTATLAAAGQEALPVNQTTAALGGYIEVLDGDGDGGIVRIRGASRPAKVPRPGNRPPWAGSCSRRAWRPGTTAPRWPPPTGCSAWVGRPASGSGRHSGCAQRSSASAAEERVALWTVSVSGSPLGRAPRPGRTRFVDLAGGRAPGRVLVLRDE